VAPLAPGGSPRPAALSLLQAASESPSALLRCNAVEAVAPDADASRSVIQRGLVDSNRAVRFVSAMAVGTHRLCDLSLLVEPLLRDESESVRAAAIFALSQCGRRVDPTPLASMILSDDPEVRGNAALVLGEMGNPTALPLLDGCLGRGMALANPARVRIVELQVAEAQVRLGDARAADPVRAALFAPPEQAELVALACQICGRIKDERSVASLRGLVEANGNDARPPEVRLAAIAALAQLGALSTDVLPMVEFLAASDRPEVRAQAAVTLGRLGDPRGLATAARLMADHDPFVQVAAAGAVTALTGPGRATGVSG
jgi:HEAT repeat protein